MTEILQFKPRAIAHIKSIIDKQGKNLVFRLSVKQTGCSGYMYVPDVIEAPLDTDIEIMAEAPFQIFIDANCVAMLQGTVVDFVEKQLGAKLLEFQNPNAQGACGCGESFHLKEDLAQ